VGDMESNTYDFGQWVQSLKAGDVVIVSTPDDRLIYKQVEKVTKTTIVVAGVVFKTNGYAQDRKRGVCCIRPLHHIFYDRFGRAFKKTSTGDVYVEDIV
jgi:hypothetical protein